MGVFECLLIVIALYVLISFILGFISVIKLIRFKILQKMDKLDLPLLEEEYIKHEIKVFFTCTWVFGLAYN